MKEFIALIPARYASTRFPGKPLARLGGREMILHVCDRVKEAGLPLAVATDDQRIFDLVVSNGYRCVMTSPDHKSGTDRVAEAYRNLGEKYRVIINVQGDEPFIAESQLKALCDCFADGDTEIATLCRPFPADAPFSALEDPNLVKVVRSDNGRALMFSRNPIPYLRGVDKEKWPSSFPYLSHVGIYGYRSDILPRLTSLPQSPLEKAESLEQLRWLQAGYRISAAITTSPTIGIDTPADLEAAERFISRVKNS